MDFISFDQVCFVGLMQGPTLLESVNVPYI